MTSRRLRVFVSSPSDVFAERERLERVIARLDGEHGGNLLEAVRWERTYYTAAKTFQDQIPLPSETDLVICIFWKRLGFELPPDYRRADGTTPTGSEFEFENALEASRAKGTPDVFVYRKSAAVLLDAERLDQEQAQFAALNAFWTRWFRSGAGHFTAAFHPFETTDAFEVAVEEHLRQWLARNKVTSPGTVWPIALRGSPFRGLQAFEAGHANVFFGRRRAIERARERLAEAAARSVPFLLVLGASGSGKSSLARAGVAPRVVQPGVVPGVDVWRICTVRPGGGDSPLDALACALYGPDALPELAQGDSPTPANFAAAMAGMPEAAGRAVRLALGRTTVAVGAREQFGRPVVGRLLLVIDQLEEALGDAAFRDAFGAALEALVATGCVWAVATLRSDLYARFQASAPLMRLREGGAQLDLLPPTPAELAEMIERPAAAAGLRFDRTAQGLALDEVLADAAGQPGALPLLQLTLDALFDARDGDVLTFAAHDALGGLAGVIERSAEAALAALDPDAAAALPGVLRSLVDLAADGTLSGRAVPAATVQQPGAARLVAAFTAARLLVVETHGGESRVRVAHEALLSGWPRAAALIAADAEALRTRGRVEAATRNWLQKGRHDDFLLPHGRPLAEAVELAARHPDGLDADCVAFIDASRAADAAHAAAARAAAEKGLRVEAEAQQARADAATSVARRTRVAAGVVSVLLVLAAGAAAMAWAERNQARHRTAEAERSFAAALAAGAGMVDVANAHLADGGMSRDAAQSLLHTAESSLGDLAQSAGTAAPRLQQTRARLLVSFSAVQLALCDSAGGRGRATEAVHVAEAMPTSRPRDVALLRALDALGQAAFADGDRPAAIAAYRRAEQVAADGGLGAEPDEADMLHSVLRHRAMAQARDDAPGALQLYREDLAWLDRATMDRPDDATLEGQQALVLGRIASLALAKRRLDEGAGDIGREAEILQHLAALQPSNLEWQHGLASNWQRRSRLSDLQGDRATAIAQARTALDIATRVAAHDPGHGMWQVAVVSAQIDLAQLLIKAGDQAGAVAAARPGLAALDSLVGAKASSPTCQMDAEMLLQRQGMALMQNKDPSGGVPSFTASLQLAQTVATATPSRQNVLALAHAQLWLARGQVIAQHFEPAVEAYQAALRTLQQPPLADDATRDRADDLAYATWELGNVQVLLGRTGEALATHEAGRALATSVLQAHTDAPGWQHVAVVNALGIAGIQHLLKRPDAQLAALEDAVARADQVAGLSPPPDGWRNDVFDSHAQRGEYELAAGALPAAAADLRTAAAAADGLIAADPLSEKWHHERSRVGGLLAQATLPAATSAAASPPAEPAK